MDDTRPLTYGDFPELFEGLPRDEPIDLDDDRTHRAVLWRGSQRAWSRLYPPAWYEARRPRMNAEEESMRLAERLLGPGTSLRDVSGSGEDT